MFRLPSRRVAAVLAVFWVQLVIGILGISRNPTTPFDEPAHFDYVVKLSKGHVPKVNEKFSQTTLEWMSCESLKPKAWSYLEPCGSTQYSPRNAPFWGQSTATGYAPNYYIVTAIPYKVCDLITGYSPIQCARSANSLWLSFGAAITSAMMIYLGAPAIVAGISSLGFFTLPAVLLQGITVNTDAAALAASSLYILVAILLAKSTFSNRRALWLYQLSVFLLLPIKQTTLPMAAFGALLLWQWKLKKTSKTSIRTGIESLVAFTATVAAAFLWQGIQIFWRDSGYKDYMTGWLKQDPATVIDSLNLAFVSGLSPFSLLVWDPLILKFTGTAATFIALLCWISILSSKKDSHSEVHSDTKATLEISDGSAMIGFLMAIAAPVAMAYVSWISFATAAVQPRYYMATAVTLGCIGIAATKSRSLQIFATLILGMSVISTIYALLR